MIDRTCEDCMGDALALVAQIEAQERLIETLRGDLQNALSLIGAMMTNDPNEPVSDAGHTLLDIWTHDFEKLRERHP